MAPRNELYMLKIGVVQATRGVNSERTTEKRLYCDVVMFDGITITNLPFYGGGVDSVTAKPHGLFFPPAIGQQIGVLYVEGNFKNPIGCFPIPFPGKQADMTKYDNIMLEGECMVAHKSGSKVLFKSDGSIEIYNGNNTGFIKMNNSTGQVNINNNLTVDI